MKTGTCLALMLAASVSLGAHAQTNRDEPAQVVSGGIGVADLQRLEQQGAAYNLHMLLTDTKGNYLANVAIVVRDPGGNEVARLTSEGPVVMAALPAGRYTVEATFDGTEKNRSIQVPENGHRQVILRWPATPATT